MQAILESLARYLANAPGEELAGTRIILPNRRAGLFLATKPLHVTALLWAGPRPYMPSTTSSAISASLNYAIRWKQFSILHDVHKELKENAESLDEFYHWGEIMLHDFDEMDKYLVDPRMLFTKYS